MNIPFADLALQHKQIEDQINAAIKKVIDKGDFILGEDVVLFEKEFADFCGSKYAVGVSSGTAALFLALASLGIKEGDEVIVPDFTYIATALAVSYTGAKPVFVDVRDDTYNLDVFKIKQAITKNTKALIPVHLYGQPADMEAVLKIAKEYNLKVIEDAAQAHGAHLKFSGGSTCVAGSMSDIGCFSFYPSKNLGGMGDGGMLVTNNEEAYKKLLMLRDYGRVSKYEHASIGYNSRLDTLQAAVLRIKLQKLDAWNSMRRKAADIYNNLLEGLDGVIRPYVLSSAEHIYHVYGIRIKMRDRFVEAAKKAGVSVIIHYPIPIHMQKAYQDLGYKKGDFVVSEDICREIVSLPMFPHIKQDQIEYVVDIIKKAVSA